MFKNLILIVALIPMLSSISNATCPDATWDGPHYYTYIINSTCSLHVEYCYRDQPHSIEKEIYIGDFYTVGDCMSMGQTQGGYPDIDWAELWLDLMIESFETEIVFDEIEPCDFGTSESEIYKYIVKNGGCYESGYRLVGEPPLQDLQYFWEVCEQTPFIPKQCYEFYKICWIYDGTWYLHTEPGPTMLWNFNCQSPCTEFCE